MQEQNPYQPPSSNILQKNTASGEKLTLEEALAKDYNFNIGDVIRKAWENIEGVKLQFLFGLIGIVVIEIICGIVLAILPRGAANGLSFFINIAVGCLTAGFVVMTLRRLRGQDIDVKRDFLSISPFFNPLLIAGLLSTLLIALGMLLLIIPGIYLSVSYCLTQWIIADHPGTSAWQAMEASRKIVTRNWFKMFGLILVLGIVVGISAIPLGIGLFWTIPLYYFSIGCVYQTIFEK